MTPERSSESGIGRIPDGSASVNSLVAAAVAGLPARLFPVGLQVANGATRSELAGGCMSLIRMTAKANMCGYFSTGDIYLFTDPYSQERKDLEEDIRHEFGEATVKRLREFAKIARRWPIDRRNPDLPWQYYRDHKPGMPGKPDVKVSHVVRLRVLSAVVEAGEELLTLVGSGGKVYEARRKVEAE